MRAGKGGAFFRRGPAEPGDHLEQIGRELRVQPGQHVLQHRHGRKDADVLEGAREAGARAAMRAQAGHVGAAQHDASAADAGDTGDQVEQRRLAGAVRPDQGVDAALRHRHVDIVDRDQSRIAAGDAGQLEKRHQRLLDARRSRSGSRPAGRNSTAATMIRPFTTRRTSLTPRSTSGSRVSTQAPSTGASGVPIPPSSA